MQNINDSLTLALDGSQGARSVETRQDDFGSRLLTFSFTDRLEPFVIPGDAEVRVNFRRPDGEILSFSSAGEESVVDVDPVSGTVSVAIPQEAVLFPANVLCDVSILSEGKKLTSETFVLVVNPAVGSAENFSATESHDLFSDLIAEAGNALASAAELAAFLEEKVESGAFNGAPGAPGAAGRPGRDGADGFSPRISISAVSGGNLVSITDAGGTRSFTVLNGSDGRDGTNGRDGSDGRDYVITQADYAAISNVVIANLPVYDGTVVSGGQNS